MVHQPFPVTTQSVFRNFIVSLIRRSVHSPIKQQRRGIIATVSIIGRKYSRCHVQRMHHWHFLVSPFPHRRPTRPSHGRTTVVCILVYRSNQLPPDTPASSVFLSTRDLAQLGRSDCTPPDEELKIFYIDPDLKMPVQPLMISCSRDWFLLGKDESTSLMGH